MNYQDHGIKLLSSTQIVAKRASCVAYALMEIFTPVGLPKILHSENGRELSGMARHSSDHNSPLDDHFIYYVISDTKNIWPEVGMV